MTHSLPLWIGFHLLILGMLAFDLGILHRKTHVVRIREALLLSGLWISLALIFNAGVYYKLGERAALEFLTGYLVEKSLSVDNIFVFVMIFSYFKISRIYQHKVLFWGILGALLMRAFFIVTGIALIHKFHWIIYVFGGFLIFTGIKVGIQTDKDLDLEHSSILKILRRIIPVTHQFEGGHFFVKKGAKWFATPLFVALLIIEASDVIFAFDSIPAVLAITSDPFIVYSSNIFAILGLRSLYFALAGVMDQFHYLKYGLSAILIFVGSKMLFSKIFPISIGVSLAVIGGILLISVLSSLLHKSKPD